ncbi:acyltransferase [Faecalicatena sp. AGMB00832]|uniref:Acyltransferase n=1 Tax=Faecalicatena faecalis TaxID=2726362 RepID=A0ABS6DAP6_9FIRM|nr:acyltransferase family protein [Faecalicatena faecalis]MBU3878704.1 acyltransferase [Faecalicatena faecalis]
MTRKSNIELIRIFAIIIITLSHLAWNTTVLLNEGINNIIGDCFVIGGRIGVNIFILITGYFLCLQQRRFKSILKLWLQIFFYSIILYIISILLFHDSINITEFITYLLPVIFKKWWYASAIIGLYLIIPILNLLILQMSKNTHRLVLVVSTFMQVIIPTITNQETFYSDLCWFVYIYFIAAYIRKYFEREIEKWKSKKQIIIFLAIFTWILIFLSIIIMGKLGNYWGIFKRAQYYFASNTSFFALLDGILWFIAALTIKDISNNFVNTIAKHTFAVYLIQSHPFFNKHIYDYFNSIVFSATFWLQGFAYIVFLFICAFIMDSIKEPTVEKMINKMEKRKAYKKLEKILNYDIPN